jgi:hypothetical protein
MPNLSRNRLAEAKTQEVIESKHSSAAINMLVLCSGFKICNLVLYGVLRKIEQLYHFTDGVEH